MNPMDCEQARLFLAPYLDSELDPTTTFLIQEHLGRCPGCSTRFASERSFDRQLNQRLRRVASGERMWDRALAAALTQAPRRRAAPTLRRFSLRGLGWVQRLSLVTALIAIGLVSRVWMVQQERLAREHGHDIALAAVERHRDFLTRHWTPSLETDSPAAVASYFANTRFSVPSLEHAIPGLRTIGAHMLDVDGVPAACVLYEYRHEPLTVYVMNASEMQAVRQPRSPSECLGDHEEHVIRGYRCVLQKVGDNVVCAVHPADSDGISRTLAGFGIAEPTLE